MSHQFHQGQPVLHVGAALDQAKAVVLMLHGRGANAEDILSLSSEFKHNQVAYLAPQAAGSRTLPHRQRAINGIPTASSPRSSRMNPIFHRP